MVPPPGFHMIRFHGVLAGHAADRAEVVPAAADERSNAAAVAPQLALFADAGDRSDTSTPRRRPWAWLLRHVFALDVTVCPTCDGSMRWREIATSPDDIARLVASRSRGPRSPPRVRRPPRAQLELDFGVAL